MSYESNVPTKERCLYCKKPILKEMYGGDGFSVWHKRCLGTHTSNNTKRGKNE